VKDALKAIEVAHDEALAIAKTLYPAGASVGAMLRSGQKCPTSVTICGPVVHIYDFGKGTRASLLIRVKLDASTARTPSRRYREVSPKDIVALEAVK
jgi:hypothetical protein